jgi:hypothetical protein
VNDVDVQAMERFALIGVPIEQLSVEVGGHFSVCAYLGLDDVPGSGYERISCRVRLRAPGATPQLLAHLRERCRRSSPVGDSLAR